MIETVSWKSKNGKEEEKKKQKRSDAYTFELINAKNLMAVIIEKEKKVCLSPLRSLRMEIYNSYNYSFRDKLLLSLYTIKDKSKNRF